MYILKEFQEKAVKGLLDHTYEAINNPQNQIPILLEAPTGSGKTVMMASFIERLVEELRLQPGLNDNVAFVWFAPNTLHVQSFLSLQKMYADTNKLNCIDLSNLGTNPVLNTKDLLFINWSSVDKEKNLWRKENESNTNLETLIENTYANDTKIILVIDEAHLSAFTGTQAKAVRKLINAKVEILVTATPLNRPQRNVFISRKEVIDEEMIKKGVRLNIGLKPSEQKGDNVHAVLLKAAMAKKKELAAYYDKELGEGVVNPLLLIQLPSENKSLSTEDNEIRTEIEALLDADYGITKNNGRLAVWLSGEKEKDGLEELNALQDVLIFKQAIAQGWDCPRAAVLVSYRKVNSPNFGVQTVGRILRMPHQKHYNTDELNYGYVFTNIETNKINFVPADVDFFDYQLAERKNNKGWTFDSITNAIIKNDRAAAGVLSSNFEQIFFLVMINRYKVKILPDSDLFDGPKEADFETIRTLKKRNKKALIENGWEFEIDEHQISLPVDIELDPYEVNTIMLYSDQTKSFAITTAEFKEMFDRFCYDNITRLNRSKSWKKLREVLISFAEYFLNLYETDAHKFYLFPQNRELVAQHIVEALEKFDMWQKREGNERRRVENFEWEVPEYRYYSEKYKREHIDTHALEPFFEYNSASKPEIAFKEYLKSIEKDLEWWYKNGDQGKEHFAVPYTDSQGVLRLFYVDFIIKFKSGKIGLFDTKTQNSDAEAANKHNALLDYMEKENENNPNREFVGGVLVVKEVDNIMTYRYCVNRIENTDDLTGWDFFNPNNI